MLPRSLLLAAALAVAVASCGQPAEDGDGGAPAPTVTVTETVTAAPPSPSPTATAAPDPCAELEPGSNVALPVLFVTAPQAGEQVSSGFTVEGCTNAFEATISWQLVRAPGGEVLAEGFETATCGTGCLGTFEFTVEYDVDEEVVAHLRVFELSAQDGSEVNVTSIPLRLTP